MSPPFTVIGVRLAAGHRLFVETREAFEAPPVGCAELAGWTLRLRRRSARC